MGATRKLYEAFLDHFDALCQLRNPLPQQVDALKEQVLQSVRKAEVFRLFDIDLPDEFIELLTQPTKDVEKEQTYLCKHLFFALGQLLFEFETSGDRIDYGRALEISRTALPYDVLQSWNIVVDIPEQFSYLNSFFFQMNQRWLGPITKEEFENYAQELRAAVPPLRNQKPDQDIPEELQKKVKAYYQTRISEYRDYIFKNYPEIKDEFPGFNTNIRMYLTRQEKNIEGDIIMSMFFYRNQLNDEFTLYPKYLNFIYRFGNCEELEDQFVSATMSLFNENDLSKYGRHFSVNDIHYELHQIFMNLAGFEDLKAYAIYLLRAQTNRVEETENEYVLKDWQDKKWRLFLDNIPNLENLKKILQNDGKLNYDYVMFKIMPDDETIKFIRSEQIPMFRLEEMSRDQVNMNNGLMIHWFIKDRLGNLGTKVISDMFSEGELLIQRLEQCPVGSKGWVEFENICTDAFKYLYSDGFRNYTQRTQSYTHDHIFRRDLIVNNNFSDATGFWARMKADFNANVIVIDFKNYADVLEQNEFYLPSKYLNALSGKFGLVMCRRGLGNASKQLQRKMFNRDNELLLCLTENDIIGMLREKMSRQDPTYRLENQLFMLYEME